MIWVVVISLFLAGVIGFFLSLLTLPGIWLPIAIAIGFEFFYPGTFNWWVIGAAAGLGLLAELLEFAASAFGATKAGGTKRAAMGAIVGTLLGAIAGSFIALFPIGTIVGAIAGAGLGAGLLDSSRNERSLKDCATVGAGAAAARGVAIVIKGLFGAVMALVLIAGAIAQGF